MGTKVELDAEAGVSTNVMPLPNMTRDRRVTTIVGLLLLAFPNYQRVAF